MTESFELEELLNRYAAGSCTREEFERLLQLIAKQDTGETPGTHWRKSWDAIPAQSEISPEWQSKLTTILRSNAEEAQAVPTAEITPAIRPRRWLVAAAMTFLLVSGYLVRHWLNRQPSEKPPVQIARETMNHGHERATLTLADGREIDLDTASLGNIAVQSGVKISKSEEGELLYYLQPDDSGVTGYNTITVPRSGDYAVVLSDGTRVHLNAASSLRFPVSFSGPTRDVSLSGEGYFEVMKNPARPFHVKTDGFTVEVLGTHFNVKSYPEDGGSAATLVEGKVRIKKEGASAAGGLFLRPNQQADLSASGKLTLNPSPNLEEVLAWQTNTFRFANRPVSSILKDVSRWYDVKVAYRGNAPDKRLTGTFSRMTDISQVVAMLRYAGVKVKIAADQSLLVGE